MKRIFFFDTNRGAKTFYYNNLKTKDFIFQNDLFLWLKSKHVTDQVTLVSSLAQLVFRTIFGDIKRGY